MSSKAVNDDMIVLVVDEKGHSKEYPLDAVTTSPIILNVESLVDSSNFKETTSELHEYSSHSDDNYEAEYLEEDYIKELEDEEEKSDTDYVGDGDEPVCNNYLNSYIIIMYVFHYPNCSFALLQIFFDYKSIVMVT